MTGEPLARGAAGGGTGGGETAPGDGLDPLHALSPLDGRYAARLAEVRARGSEAALIRARVRIEIEWLEALADEPRIGELPALGPAARHALRAIGEAFDEDDARAVKALERTTNHDVKAVEYFLKERLAELPELAPHREFVHFACTSEDINNLAWGLLVQGLRRDCLLPALDRVGEALVAMAHSLADVPMLSRTHGQPASPTTMGKELANFVARLAETGADVAEAPLLGKMNGAVGNYNAHRIAYPDVDWEALSARVVTGLGLRPNPWTTQIEPHDHLARLFDAMARLNTVLIDLCRDLWGYIGLGYFRSRVVAGEVGSSTMPHKVNPIDFENAEGNLGVANALLEHLARKLPVSRWQRDLTDSTVLRNIGPAFGYTVLALDSVWRGLTRLEPDAARMEADLGDAWEVLAEAIQTVMRKHGIEEPYERLKALTRGRAVDRSTLEGLLASLELPPEERARLRVLTPLEYVGDAPRLARARRWDRLATTGAPGPDL